MVKSYPLLKPLTDQLMKEVRAYGILEVSIEQYQITCNSIVRFAQSSQVDSYSPELMDSYKDNLDTRCSSGEICKEYHRFQLRVIRMLSSLAESGVVDFSSTKSHPLKYIVSDETSSLVEMILDSYPISNAAKNDLRAPTRHFLWYAEQLGIKPECIDTFGGSDANRLNKNGIETIVLACGMENCHSTGEYTSIEELEKSTELTLRLMTAD